MKSWERIIPTYVRAVIMDRVTTSSSHYTRRVFEHDLKVLLGNTSGVSLDRYHTGSDPTAGLEKEYRVVVSAVTSLAAIVSGDSPTSLWSFCLLKKERIMTRSRAWRNKRGFVCLLSQHNKLLLENLPC